MPREMVPIIFTEPVNDAIDVLMSCIVQRQGML